MDLVRKTKKKAQWDKIVKIKVIGFEGPPDGKTTRKRYCKMFKDESGIGRPFVFIYVDLQMDQHLKVTIIPCRICHKNSWE